MNMAAKKKKTAKKKLPKEPVVLRLIRELMLLSKKEQLEVVNRGMSVTLDTDNYGQIIIYTDMMYGDDDDVVDFEVDCPRVHCDEEEHECEF